MLPIESATPAHLADIRSLLTDCNLPDSDLSAPMLRHFLVAREGDAIVGCIGLEIFEPHGLLRSLAVAPPSRQHGLASMLVEALEAYARELQVEQLYLLTTSAPSFFARKGYSELGRNHVPATILESNQFAQLCPASATCLAKSLKLPTGQYQLFE